MVGNLDPSGSLRGPDKSLTLSRFVVKPQTRLAFTSALTITEKLGEMNPVIVHGDTGTGKSHLLNAIGNEISTQYPSLKVAVVTPLEMADNLFMDICNSFDVLLVDDLEELRGNEGMQAQFIEVLDCLLEKGKQIVMACQNNYFRAYLSNVPLIDLCENSHFIHIPI